MIEVKHLTKRYGDHTAVSDLSFTIENGKIYGFLGPNGAGKSTTMNIMTGCLGASEGEVKIDGFDIFEQPRQAKKRIGYLPEQPPLYLDRTPREYLTFVARAKQVPSAQVRQEVAQAMEATQITHVADRLIRNLSKGYRQRVGIAQALLGNPEVIILDEPTVGLDPRQIIEIRELIQRLGKEHTVILSSHILSEVQAICQVVLILSQGKLVACDTPDNLERLFRGKTIVRMGVEADEARVRELLDQVQGIGEREISRENGLCRLRLEVLPEAEQEICRDLFAAFSAGGCPIVELTTERASLEDVFLELTQREENGEEEA